MVHYFEQRANLHTMTGGASASGASNAFGMGPSSGYIRKLTLVYILIYVPFCMPCFDALGHVIVVHMLHDLAGMLYMTNTSCLHVLNHGFMIHISIYDVIITMLIVIYVIIFMVLFFWIKLTWKLLKHLTRNTAIDVAKHLRMGPSHSE
jgi:hypothetical protein